MPAWPNSCFLQLIVTDSTAGGPIFAQLSHATTLSHKPGFSTSTWLPLKHAAATPATAAAPAIVAARSPAASLLLLQQCRQLRVMLLLHQTISRTAGM